MSNAVRADLQGALEGYHVEVNPDAVTMGFFEDAQSDRASQMLDSVAGAVVGGNLPKGTDRASLRRYTPAELGAIVAAIVSTTSLPKNA